MSTRHYLIIQQLALVSLVRIYPNVPDFLGFNLFIWSSTCVRLTLEKLKFDRLTLFWISRVFECISNFLIATSTGSVILHVSVDKNLCSFISNGNTASLKNWLKDPHTSSSFVIISSPSTSVIFSLREFLSQKVV